MEPTLTLTVNIFDAQTLSTMNEYDDIDENKYDTTYIDSIEKQDSAVTSNNNVGIIVGVSLGCIALAMLSSYIFLKCCSQQNPKRDGKYDGVKTKEDPQEMELSESNLAQTCQENTTLTATEFHDETL